MAAPCRRCRQHWLPSAKKTSGKHDGESSACQVGARLRGDVPENMIVYIAWSDEVAPAESFVRAFLLDEWLVLLNHSLLYGLTCSEIPQLAVVCSVPA